MAFNLDREHSLGIGSLKGFGCEVLGYKLACRAALGHGILVSQRWNFHVGCCIVHARRPECLPEGQHTTSLGRRVQRRVLHQQIECGDGLLK